MNATTVVIVVFIVFLAMIALMVAGIAVQKYRDRH